MANENESKPATMKQCEVCCNEEHKYRCPACDIRTCSMTCVRQHKQNTKCTGVRDKVGFVPVKEFNEETLHNGEF